MKRLSTILKNTSSFDLTAYIYRSGIAILKRDKKSNLNKYYFIKKNFRLPEDIARVVLHDPHDILSFGTDFSIQFFANNESPWSKAKGIDFRLTEFVFSHGGRIQIEEYRDHDQNSFSWNSRGGHITVQGKGYWSSNNYDWKESHSDPYSEDYDISFPWYDCYEPEEIKG